MRALWRISARRHEEAVEVVAVLADRHVEVDLVVLRGTGAPCARRTATPVARRHGPVQPSAIASAPEMMPTPSSRSRKMRFLRSSLSPSSTSARTAGMRAAHISLSVGRRRLRHAADAAEQCVRRAPVSSSRMSQIISRALMNQRNGVNAPSSIAIAPVHVRWSRDARELAQDHAVPLAALRDLDAAASSRPPARSRRC